MPQGLSDAGLDIGGEAIAAAMTHMQLHDGDPGGAGTANVITGGRFACDFSSTNGDLALVTPVAFTGMGAEVTVPFVTMWNASTSGTLIGTAGYASGDEETNAAGEITVTAVTIPATTS